MKKILAAVLAASTVLSLASISASAATNYDVEMSYGAGIANVYTDPNTDKDYIDGGLLPDSAIYLCLNEAQSYAPLSALLPGSGTGLLASQMADKDYFSVKFDKGDNNAKMISKMSLVQKKDAAVSGWNTSDNRAWWVKIELKDDFTDKEFKITPTIKFTAKSTATGYAVDDTITFSPVLFFSNQTKNADHDTMAGTGGIVVKPTKNDDNEITWEDESHTIASLNFFSDNNASKFFPKLSTQWDNAEYEDYFKNQNAFQFKFIGRPTISSTSRATLALYNPYVNEDGDETVDHESIVIFEVDVDGAYTDVTSDFTYMENDNGDMVWVTKTRTLGTYVMCEITPDMVEDVIEDVEDDIIYDIVVVGDKINPITGNFH